MNDLSTKKRHAYTNGYAHNLHHTISHKPVIGTKSMGFTHRRQGQKYATTKSLPPKSRQSSWMSVSRNGGSGNNSTYRGPRGRLVHSSTAFHKHLKEKKEKSISYFDIELEKSEKYIHRPGEELNGSIQMDITKNIEIRFLELVVVGQGSVTIRKNKKGIQKTQKETYLCKRSYVIGTSDARWTSVLTPGHYVSTFKVKLPKDLPSSLHFHDTTSGFSADIGYYLKARLCDDIGSSSTRSIVSVNNAVKVLFSKRQIFSVQRAFDVHLIPNAMTPVVHDEEVILSCGPNSVANFTLSLDRAVFLAGDDIRLQISSQIPSSQKIKDITCALRQHVTLKEIGVKECYILAEICRNAPQEETLDVTIPTQTHLISSFLTGSKNLKVTYSLDVDIRMRPAGGKVSFSIPIAMGPCAEPIYAEKTASRKFVPVFNRPMRFPCFSDSQKKSPALMEDRISRSSQSINVTTKYNNTPLSRCFLCCFIGSAVD
ncbi:uncharacterized protein [Haliotis cracherodii]|uniref:uncharacterized protein n=1 Tax=Haliotis cracherodii TaxID=6455 RepID=UPI0039ED796B